MSRHTTAGDYESLAKQAAGNWQHFDSFAWHEQPDDAENFCIVYTENRDSGPLDQSNAATIAKELGSWLAEEDETKIDIYGEHHSHWACGWVDGYAIRVYRDGQITDAFKKWCDIQEKLSDYPVLDEEDLSRREWEEFEEGWESYGHKDFCWELREDFKLGDAAWDFLLELDKDVTREWYCTIAPEPYISEDSGVSIRVDSTVQRIDRQQLADFLLANWRKKHDQADAGGEKQSSS